MARGDVTTVITINMAQNDTTDRQPASGVEEMFLAPAGGDIGGTLPNKAPDILLNLIDGTNNGAAYFQNDADGGMGATFQQGKYMADNTNFFRVTHQGASTQDYGFAVIAVG